MCSNQGLTVILIAGKLYTNADFPHLSFENEEPDNKRLASNYHDGLKSEQNMCSDIQTHRHRSKKILIDREIDRQIEGGIEKGTETEREAETG